jgi:hypothetical protein
MNHKSFEHASLVKTGFVWLVGLLSFIWMLAESVDIRAALGLSGMAAFLTHLFGGYVIFGVMRSINPIKDLSALLQKKEPLASWSDYDASRIWRPQPPRPLFTCQRPN